MSSDTRPHVVVVGAGFGGLAAIRALKRAAVRITVFDRSNHYLFQPLLYQVATAALSPANIASPIRRLLRDQKNVEVFLGDVAAVEAASRVVVLEDGARIAYDQLILAAGMTQSYFGHDSWARFAPGLKSMFDALEIRQRVLLAFEIAEREPEGPLRREWLTFVVIGGGPTGVELAGTLAEVSRQTLARDFRRINTASARVILVEGGPRVLPTFVPEMSAKAQSQLERLGVQVWTDSKVTEIDESGVSLGSERIAARTVLWAAGVAAAPLARSLGAPVDRAGRVMVTPELTLPGHDNVYVIGDMAHLEINGALVPGVAPAAMQEGAHAAANVLRTLDGKPLQPFRYKDKGMLATIGRGAAVAHVGRWKASGLIAWLMWLFIHIWFLIGFRNRTLVLLQWAWSYITFDRGARLIYPVEEPGAHPAPVEQQRSS